MKQVSAIVVALLCLAALSCERANEPQHPPVVIIMADTLRADYVGAYGFSGDVSPHLDGLAADGVLFRNCVSQSPWTKPSIATLMTGLYPEVHKVLTEEGKYRGRMPGGAGGADLSTDALSEDAATLAEQLKASGYVTAGFVANPWIRSAHGYGQGFDVFNTEGADNEMPAKRIVARAVEWLKAQPADGPPYFLYLHFMDVHGPYTASREHFDALAGSSAESGPPVPLTEAQYGRIPPYLRAPDWAKEDGSRDVRTWRRHYAAGLRSLDAAVGELFAALRERGDLDESLVVFTADHGEELYDHGRWDHGYTLFEEQVHVPLVVRYPNAKHAGTVIEPAVGVVDVLPTILGFVGATIPPGVQGNDLAPVIAGKANAVDGIVTEAVKWRPDQRSVRTSRYKLIHDGATGRSTLYDLHDDPGERVNVADANPEVVDRLVAILRNHVAANAAHPGLEGRAADVPPDVAERLRSLGYLE